MEIKKEIVENKVLNLKIESKEDYKMIKSLLRLIELLGNDKMEAMGLSEKGAKLCSKFYAEVKANMEQE